MSVSLGVAEPTKGVFRITGGHVEPKYVTLLSHHRKLHYKQLTCLSHVGVAAVALPGFQLVSETRIHSIFTDVHYSDEDDVMTFFHFE